VRIAGLSSRVHVAGTIPDLGHGVMMQPRQRPLGAAAAVWELALWRIVTYLVYKHKQETGSCQGRLPHKTTHKELGVIYGQTFATSLDWEGRRPPNDLRSPIYRFGSYPLGAGQLRHR
jgi:hypothetical protein